MASRRDWTDITLEEFRTGITEAISGPFDMMRNPRIDFRAGNDDRGTSTSHDRVPNGNAIVIAMAQALPMVMASEVRDLLPAFVLNEDELLERCAVCDWEMPRSELHSVHVPGLVDMPLDEDGGVPEGRGSWRCRTALPVSSAAPPAAVGSRRSVRFATSGNDAEIAIAVAAALVAIPALKHSRSAATSADRSTLAAGLSGTESRKSANAALSGRCSGLFYRKGIERARVPRHCVASLRK